MGSFYTSKAYIEINSLPTPTFTQFPLNPCFNRQYQNQWFQSFDIWSCFWLIFSSPVKSLGNAARQLFESNNKNFVLLSPSKQRPSTSGLTSTPFLAAFVSPSKRAPKRAVLCQAQDQSGRIQRGAFCSRFSFKLLNRPAAKRILWTIFY